MARPCVTHPSWAGARAACLPASLHAWLVLCPAGRTGSGKVLEAGSSVLVIRDKDGYVFGGYACDSWKATPDFYGSESCFLFRLEPELMVFPTSGKNKNYQYFNYGMEQLPNGLVRFLHLFPGRAANAVSVSRCYSPVKNIPGPRCLGGCCRMP